MHMHMVYYCKDSLNLSLCQVWHESGFCNNIKAHLVVQQEVIDERSQQGTFPDKVAC